MRRRSGSSSAPATPKPGAIPLRTFLDGQPLRLPSAIANQSAFTVGASGSGKSRFYLARIETELNWNLGRAAFCVSGTPDLRSDIELLDPKT